MSAIEAGGRRGHRAVTAAVGSLVAAGFLAAAAWLPRSYQATASVALSTSIPVASAHGGRGSDAGGATVSIARTADLASRDLMSAPAVRNLAAHGFTQPYAVGPDPYSGSGAVLDITATGSDPARLQALLSALVSQLRETLARLPGAPRSADGVQVVPLAADLRPARTVSAAAHPALAIVLFAAVVALGCPVVIDARRGRRRGPAKLAAQVPAQAERQPA